MTRKYSSISVQTTLGTALSSNATSMTVATGTASALMGGITLGAAVNGVYPDQFTLAVDADTINEEIVFVTMVSSDTLTIVRGRAGTSAITHSGGASVKHVLTSNDLDYFNTTSENSVTLNGAQTVTGVKTFSTAPVISGATLSGTVTSTATISGGTVNPTTLQQAGVQAVTVSDTQTLTNKTLTAPIATYSVNAQTGTSYTPVLSDAGAIITMNSSAANTVSIPTNATTAFPIGACLTIITINAAATTTGTQTTITAATPLTTTIAAAGESATSPKLRAQYSSASVIKIATDLWYVVGDLTQ